VQSATTRALSQQVLLHHVVVRRLIVQRLVGQQARCKQPARLRDARYRSSPCRIVLRLTLHIQRLNLQAVIPLGLRVPQPVFEHRVELSTLLLIAGR